MTIADWILDNRLTADAPMPPEMLAAGALLDEVRRWHSAVSHTGCTCVSALTLADKRIVCGPCRIAALIARAEGK